LKDKNALDIGSSTGGFTQILLENEIKKVTCVDVGTNQLHERIKYNDKINFFENTDIRNFESDEIFDIVTCDVSFISILNIIDAINTLASKDIIILFKPQFEVGSNVKRDKKGIVKDNNAIQKARDNFLNKTNILNWTLKYSNISKLQGKDGNVEEFFYFSK
ncbi:SAM-dependent methyltransferase, partial [Aliarcobacter butzleri]